MFVLLLGWYPYMHKVEKQNFVQDNVPYPWKTNHLKLRIISYHSQHIEDLSWFGLLGHSSTG